MKRILALGAHYDDVEIGLGGTLLKHINNGDEVFIVITDSNEYRTGNIDVRHQEQLDSLNILNIKNEQLILFKSHDDISYVVGMLDELNPNIIYTMFELDTHQAHRRCSHIGQAIGRRLITQVVLYNSGTSYNFLPNVFSIISFDFKQKLLNCFKSQIELNAINIDIIKRRESYWASLIMEDIDSYAEGLMIRKMIYNV